MKWKWIDFFFNLNGCYDNIWTSILHIVFQIVDTHHRVMDYGSEIEFYVVRDLKI